MCCIRAGISINTKTLGIVAVNKNNSDWHIDFFDFDFARIADLQDRANEVFAMTEPPIENSPKEVWCCNYCEYDDICERKGMKPEQEQEIAPAFEDLGDVSVLSAMYDLISAREQMKNAKLLEANAKQIILAESKAKHSNTINAGSFVCSIEERTSNRFDAAKFKKENPELAEAYTTTSTTTYFDIKGDI